MNTLELWNKWEPIVPLSATYELESIIENSEKLQIVLHDEQDTNKKVYVEFLTRVYSYRTTKMLYRKNL